MTSSSRRAAARALLLLLLLLLLLSLLGVVAASPPTLLDVDGDGSPMQMPMPDETVRAVLLTSEAEIGDPKQLDALAMSFRATHDPREHALVLASTAKTPVAQKSWRAWAERRGAVVWFFAPEARTEIVVARFYAYLAYVRALRASRPSVNRVAMMDATDVIFNAPFMRAIPLDAIALVEEPATLKIGACEWHERWIRGCAAYGERVFARVANESRVCAGTIAGGIAATETFLTAFTNELTRTKYCNDQGVLNVMTHTGGFRRARGYGGGTTQTTWTHEDGLVMSLNTGSRADASRLPDAAVVHFGDSPEPWKRAYIENALRRIEKEGGTFGGGGGGGGGGGRVGGGKRATPSLGDDVAVERGDGSGAGRKTAPTNAEVEAEMVWLRGVKPFRYEEEAAASAAEADADDETTTETPPPVDGGARSTGYFLVALGTQFVNEAARFVRALRASDSSSPRYPVAVLILPSDVARVDDVNAKEALFDDVVTYDEAKHAADGLRQLARTNHERYNILPRLRLWEYVPYDEYLVVDADVLCSAPMGDVWAYHRAKKQPVGASGLETDCAWHFGHVCEISREKMPGMRPGAQLPHVHAGAVYVDASIDPAGFDAFKTHAMDAFKRYDEFGFKSLHRDGGKVLEICLSYAFWKGGYAPLDFYDAPVINFNVRANEKLPSSAQRIGGRPDGRSTSGKTYPLTHYFVKAGFEKDYQSHYEALVTGKKDIMRTRVSA